MKTSFMLLMVIMLSACKPAVKWQYTELTWCWGSGLTTNTVVKMHGENPKYFEVSSKKGALNVMGDHGWELLSSQKDGNGETFLFKRLAGGGDIYWSIVTKDGK